METLLLVLVGSSLLSSVVTAEPLDLLNAEIEVIEAESNLGITIDRLVERRSGPLWIAWVVPAVEGHRYLCCWGKGDGKWRTGTCSLESRDRHFVFSDGDDFEPPEIEALSILLRIDGSRVDEVRVYSDSCRLDAGGHSVTWLGRVDPDQSVSQLASLIEASVGRGDPEDLAAEALMALALHAGTAADRELTRLANAGTPSSLREEAVFWLGEARAEAGLEALDRLLDSERDRGVKTHIAFALTLSSAPGAMERLQALGRTDPDPEVRSEALFWLAQEGGPGAAGTIRGAVDSDPDREVREQAIFALSQLPGSEGTDMLLQIIRDGSQEASARQAALFWLAQSDDDRALDLISDILDE